MLRGRCKAFVGAALAGAVGWLLLAMAAGAPADTVIGFARWREPHEQVWIGLSGIYEVPAGTRPTRSGFVRPRRPAELRALALTYAPFRLRTAEWDLVFFGRGKAPAGLVEQRLALEWTRRVMIETAGGGRGDSYGLVFSWHRGVANGGVCDEVAVFLDGEVRAGPCPGGPPGRPLERRLDPARLARVYAWYDGLQPFQADGLAGVRADAPLERVIFAGRGRKPATREEMAAIGDTAAQLLREMTAPPPRPADAQKPAAAEPTRGKSAGSTPAASQPGSPGPNGEKPAKKAAKKTPDHLPERAPDEAPPPPPSRPFSSRLLPLLSSTPMDFGPR
jgi:hypothetical protein